MAATFRVLILSGVLGLLTSPGAVTGLEPGSGHAEIRVIDSVTGRGVPLVELETVNGLLFVTDNAGCVAFHEPGLMDREIYFTVRSHGYEMKKDGFGFAGVRLTPRVGAVAEVKLTRKNLAERLGRLTGEGLHRDSALLGRAFPGANPGKVAGQDSVQAAVYRSKVRWFWGDTNRMEYPLGLFRMAGATTPLFDPKDVKSDPANGIAYEYFTDAKTGFARAMMPLPERPEGVVWVFALAVVPDEQNREKLVGFYTRRKSLADEIEQGICIYDDEKQIFTAAKELPLQETWRKPGGHPIPFEEKGVKWLLMGSPTPNVRVPATLKDVLDPTQYEAFTPLNDKGEVGEWRWQKTQPPLDSKAELALLKSGKMQREQTRFTPSDIVLHSGSVRWNEHRRRWILLAGQIGGKTSHLGEVWYAEAEHPTGPFAKAVQVATHDRQTFYNVCHHAFLDREGGRLIHFEGTYTNDFSGSPQRTPRYNYNQVLYRLALDSAGLKPAHTDAPELERIRPGGDGTHLAGQPSGKRFSVWGVNYDHDDEGRLLEDYWEKEWPTVEEDFREIKTLGANVVRIHLQVAKFMDTAEKPNQANLDRLAKLIRLAEETGLYLNLTGLGCYHKKDVPAWYDKLDEAGRWDVQERFWQAIAAVGKGHSCVFCYDLMNEPILPGEKKETDWLAGEFGGKHFVQRIALDLAGQTREEVARLWVKKLTTAIRKIDDRAMITVGVIPWAMVFKGAKPDFNAPNVGGPLDFVSVHFYPKSGEVDAALAALKVYAVGKPIVVEEFFPLSCSIEEANDFIDRSRAICSGYVSFYWGKTIEQNEKAGDLKGALVAKWLRAFQKRSAEMTSAKEEPRTHSPQRPLPEPRQQPMTKGPAFFVDPARGDDAADGSAQKPWKTLAQATRRLKPGDTLYLRGGVYHERVSLTRSGTVEKPITLAAHPGEVPILDGGLREFRESPTTAWEPLKDGAPGEYVSTKSFPQANDRRAPYQFLPGSWEPMWNIEDQRPLALGHFADSLVPLHGYRTLEDLRTTNELQSKDKKDGTVYCGPGMWFNRETGRIHIRLAHHQLAGLGDRVYRGETDPRKLPLVMAVGFGDDVLRISGIQNVRIEGLVLRGATGSPMIHVYGSEGIDLDHLHIYGGFPGLLVNASRKIQVTHSAFRGLAAPWTGRAHMKYRGTATYQIVLQNGQPVNEDIEFAHCEFTDDHDFAFFRYAKNLRFHHNFVDNFNDDGLECGAKLRWHSVHIHHNRVGACLGVFQQHEIDKDESPTGHDADSGVHVYRNIFDQRAGVYYNLPAVDDPTGAFLKSEGHLISDHGSPVYPVMRVYHNTFLRREPVFRDYFLFGLGTANLKQTERDVFNNLFVQADRVPGAVILGKDAGPLREGGNLLWGVKSSPMQKADVFAKLRASPLFADSKKYHEPGWTTLDLVADPKFTKLDEIGKPSDLRLSEGSAAINAGVVLPEKWPDPLREKDAGKPDIGAIPFGSSGWGVGIDGRIPVFGK